MSDYQITARKLEQQRAKAPFLPKPKKSADGLSPKEVADTARIALGLSAAAGGLAFGYGYFRMGLTDAGNLAYAVHYAILVFAFIFSISITGRYFLSFNKSQKLKAKEMMYSPRYFLHHLCLSILVVWGILLLIDYSAPYVNFLIHSIFINTQSGIYPENISFHDLYKLWLGGAVCLAGAWNLGLIALPWLENRQQKAIQTKRAAFGLLMGQSTGALAKRSHGSGLLPSQKIALSLEDAAHNIVILGGIGSGKTTRMINPLLLQCLQQDCGGLIFDIKGDFHYTVYKFADALSGDSERLVRLGIGGQSINLIEGLSPEMAGSFLKSSLLLSGQMRGDNSFFNDTATTLCTNALGILSFLPEKYTLAYLQDYLFNTTAKTRIQAEMEVLTSILDDNKLRALHSYQDYIENVFGKFEEKTKANIMATVAQVLSPFRNPELVDAFCRSSHLQMEKVLDGTIYLLSLPLAEWGLGGKIAYNFIKLRFFNVMQKRLTQPNWNQARPVFFLCDEYQEIASGNKDSLSDLNFWDKSRTSKTIGIVSAQSISSFYAAIGDRDIANAILQNFRQKICFRTEDQTTLDYLNRLTGQVEVEKRSYSKQRGSSSKTVGDGTQSHQSKSESISYVDKPVIDAQLMRNLQPNEAVGILVIQGHSRDDVLDTTTC